MSKYICVHISTNDEALLAHLSLLPFDSFEEKEDGTLDAYIATEEFNDFVKNELTDITGVFNAGWTFDALEDKNWNEEWESNFHPVEVDDFVRIRADFHPSVPGFQYELLIHPKMAFGTGHHQTTYMMMKAMRDISFDQKTVFDYGCGTGVLALLASKLGASNIVAVDIEEPSYQSTVENADINQCTNIDAYLGDITVVPSTPYDIVLANINRNVLLASAEALSGMTANGGILLLSGILDQDFEVINEAFSEKGFQLQKKLGKDAWLCLQYSKI